MAVILWVFVFSLCALPFLRARDSIGAEGGDFSRAETDAPFAASVAEFEQDHADIGLAAAIQKAGDELFAPRSQALHKSGVIDVDRLEYGKRAYELHCVGCHGVSGDGGGSAARFLNPRPRNFRKGLFKFTSTEGGSRPQRKDLFQTITRGLAGSSMPEFRLLPEETRWNLVEYVRYLGLRGEFEQMMLRVAQDDEELPDANEIAEIVHQRWNAEGMRSVFPGAPETDRDAASIERGRALFTDVTRGNCAACHGAGGKGDGATAGNYKDDWGYPIRPRDFTMGVFRAGSEGADLYRTIATGIKGTPMGSFSGALAPTEIWDLVHFVQSLGVERGK